jgi:hypothetical protein
MRRKTSLIAASSLAVAVAGVLAGCEQEDPRPEPAATQPQQTQQPAQQSGGMGGSRGGALDSAQDAAGRTAAGLQERQNEINDFLENDTPPE